MYTKLLLALIVALPALVDSTPTHCDRWKGSSEFRCAKSNYGPDRIHIRNIANKDVNFRIGKWLSVCGHDGINYSSADHRFGPGQSIDENFGEAQGDTCNELFIYGCKRDDNHADCIDVVTPSVN